MNYHKKVQTLIKHIVYNFAVWIIDITIRIRILLLLQAKIKPQKVEEKKWPQK